MKRKAVKSLLSKVTAILLVASMTVSIIMSCDNTCALFNAIVNVFADEIEDPDNEGEYSETDADIVGSVEPEVSDIADTVEGDDTVEPEDTEGITAEPSETESNTEDNETGLVYRQVKAEGEHDLYVSGLMPEGVMVTAESVEVEVSGANVIAAYDIKVFDENGNEWQPSEPLKISVAPDDISEKSEDETQVIYVPDELAESGKPVDIDDKSIEKIDAVIEDGNFVFEAEHFSVYVIIEHEGGEVVTPRVEFHFISPVGENYNPTVTGGIAYYTSTPYAFNNKADEAGAGNHQVTSIVRDGDKLESIEAPMNTQNTYFYGWYTVDKSSDNVTFDPSTQTFSGNITYSWPINDPLRVELDKTVSVSAARDSSNNITSITWTIGNDSGTCTDIDSEGCAHVYLAPIYSNYYFVNFHLGARGETTAETLLSRKLIVLGNSNQTEVKISDVQAPSNDPVHVVFIGWERNTGTDQSPVWSLIRTIDSDNNEIVDPGKDGKYITVGAKTVDLYPFFVQARYIEFNVGPSGNGALYQGPQLMFTSDETQGDEYALTSLATTTRNGYLFDGWYTGADGTGVQITDRSGHILSNLTYSETGTFTGSNGIVYSGTSFKIENGKLYAYNALDKLTLYAKWTPNTSTTYKVVIWKQKVSDAVGLPDADKTYDYYTYFERSFDYVSNGNSFIVGTTAADRNYASTNPNGDFTGFHLGRYDADTEINTQGSTVLNVYYDRNTYTLTFMDYSYSVTTSNNGTQYGVVDKQYVRVYRRNNRWRLTDTNNGTEYTGTRYTRNNTWVTVRTITALTGQDISSEFPITGTNSGNEIVYDNGDRWEPINSSAYNQVVVIINQIPNENTTFHWNDPETRPQKTINYYLEVLPGATFDITVNGINYALQNGKSVPARVNFFTPEDNVEIEGFTQNGSNPAFDNNNEIRNVDSVDFYYTRNTYKLTFSANYPSAYSGNEPAPQEFLGIPYELSLASYSNTAAPAKPNDNYVFDGWYEDASGTVLFDFANETMPSAPKIIYAHWKLVEYQINIDPNGGIIDSIDYSWFVDHNTLDVTGLSGTPNGFATYFDNEADQLIEPYNNLVRPYVEVSEAEAAQMAEGTVFRYVYVYRSNQEGGTGKLGAPARTAVYIKDTEESLSAFYDYYCEQVRLRQARDPELTALPRAQWEATYVSTEKYRTLRSGESYVFLTWYEVINGVRQNTPYDFSQPASHETTLVAEWRLDGGYSLLYATEYYAENNDYITANLEDWTDPLDGTSKYADGATTQAMQEPTSVMVNGKSAGDDGYVDYQFLGWQIVKVETVAGRLRYTPLEPGVYYTAGQELTVRARYSDANMVIHMQAVYQKRGEAYRRPDVISLTLDASADAMNAGTGYVDLTNSSLPNWYWPGHYWADSTHIYFGDTQANTALQLYKYATTLTESEETGATLNPAGVNYFKHTAGFKLIGFDLDSPDTDFVPDYASDAVIAVVPGTEHTLYAVWEPMVYLTVKNDTGVGPVTFNLSGTNQAVHIVNQTNGSFSRSAINPNQGITLADGESIRLVVPYGEGEMITLSGTNTLGTGYWLNSKSELGYTNPTARTLTGTYYRVPNTETFNFTDDQCLLVDAEGVVITFMAEKAPHTLVLDDNYTGGATREFTFSETPEGIVYYQTIGTTSYTLPSTSTRIGWELIGWDTDPTSTSPAYTTGAWTITDLTAFFTRNGSSVADIEVKTLYAIWEANADASTVQVWKNVPEPGDQSKDFTFTVSFSGNISYEESESYTSWFQTRYRWRTVSSESIGTGNAQGTATLTYDFTLKHNQYLEIITVKNETNQTGNRPSLQMQVTKWQRNTDGSPDTRIEVRTLSWEWIHTITATTGDPTGTGQYRNFSFQNLNLSVTEADYSDRYVLSMEVAAHTTNAVLNVSAATRKLSWTDTFAGGTVIFTNTRKTADVTIKKSLLPDTVDPESFVFNASLENGESYTLNPTSNSIISDADENNGGEWKIEGIPTGATLTITETVDADRYETVASGVKKTDNLAVTDKNAADNIFAFDVEDDTEVTFKNTLKSQKIRIVVVDDESPANYLDSANFTLPGVFPGTKFSAAGTGLVWEGSVFVGNYTLTETAMPDHAGVRYTMLQAPAILNIAGGTGGDKVTVTTGDAADTVNVSYDTATDTYIITVVNPKMMRVTLKKSVVNDYITNSFLFTVTLTDSTNTPIQLSNVYGTQGTNAQGKLEFTLVNNQTALLYVPRHANIQIAETEDYRYATVYREGPDADHLGVMNGGTSRTLSDINADCFVLCTNTRQIVGVTVEKTVVGQGGTFSFTALITENSTPLSNYTLNDNSTPADTSDDLVTDSNGTVSFTLSPADDGTDSIVLYMPSGVDLTVTESQPTTIAYTTSYTVTDPNDPTNTNTNKSGSGYTTGAIRISGTRIVTFTNTVASLVAPTAVTDSSKTIMFLLASGAVIFAGAVIHLERKKKGGQYSDINDE